jgi:hypothetical protein
MSETRLRTVYQAFGTSAARDESFSWNTISDSPGLE